jgi:signal transduction histidine kinase
LLSLICCALRHDARITYATCGLHCASAAILYFGLPVGRREPFELLLTFMLLAWVTWAASSLAWLLKRFGAHVSQLNDALRENQSQLEARIADRTRELQETQAQLLHNEKMAAFGLLAAGIAHEVGNPLTSISSIVQVLGRRDLDAYARDKFGLVGDQLKRIQGILRELVTFSRPANNERARLNLSDLIDEALGIAKYYKGMKTRDIKIVMPLDLPAVVGVRGQLVSVFLNLILNAIDATAKGGLIRIAASHDECGVAIRVSDDGAGIDAEHQARLFQPYFTTKPNGTGLGLFVSRRLIELNGGTIECTSSPGSCTTFTVTIPV